MSDPFLGQVMIFAGNFAPRGWAFCNGQSLPINQNAALYSLLGTTYGGDGVSTFNLPNLQSRVPVHAGQGSGLSAYVPGQTFGTESVQLTTAQMPSHNHALNMDATVGTSATPNGNNLAEVAGTGRPPAAVASYTTGTPTAPAQLSQNTVGNQGGSGSHENRQPSMAINYIIALEGIFPSRN